MGPQALLLLRRKSCFGFLSSLRIHRPRPGLNPASTIVTRPPSAVDLGGKSYTYSPILLHYRPSAPNVYKRLLTISRHNYYIIMIIRNMYLAHSPLRIKYEMSSRHYGVNIITLHSNVKINCVFDSYVEWRHNTRK
jgi:hypothetical protein